MAWSWAEANHCPQRFTQFQSGKKITFKNVCVCETRGVFVCDVMCGVPLGVRRLTLRGQFCPLLCGFWGTELSRSADFLCFICFTISLLSVSFSFLCFCFLRQFLFVALAVLDSLSRPGWPCTHGDAPAPASCCLVFLTL